MRHGRTFRILWIIMAGQLALQTACNKKNAITPTLPDDNTDTLTTSEPQKVRKVLIIGIDGCRGDALKMADAPNIHGLISNAIYSFDAVTRAPTISGPGWSSMLTGVWSDKHQVLNNDFSTANYTNYPSLYKFLKIQKPGIQSVSICAWSPINQYLAVDAAIRINGANDAAVKDSSVARLRNSNPDILFIHFDDVDAAGHNYGYDPMEPRYMNAIHKTDAYAGEILTALRSRKDFEKEDWLVVVSTDHGGRGTSHGGDSFTEKNIFAIFHNKTFSSKEILPDPDALKVLELSGGGLGQYAYLTAFHDVDNYNALTIRFQVKTSGLSGDIPFITNKDWYSGMNRGFVVNIKGQSWKANISDGNRRIDIDALNVPDLNDRRWHTLTTVINRSGDMTIFQDGVLCGSADISGLTTIRPPEDTRIKLVMNEDITEIYGRSNFTMANIKIWDTTLSESYIAADICDTVVKNDDPYKDRILGWWTCFDGAGNVFKDRTGSGYDFQIGTSPEWSMLQRDFCNVDIPLNRIAMVDIMPTIAGWMGLQVDYVAWKLDGQSWLP